MPNWVSDHAQTILNFNLQAVCLLSLCARDEWQLAEQLNTQFGRGEARVYVLVLVDIPKRTLREIIVDPVGEVNSGGMASTLLGMVLNTRQRGEDHPLLPFRGKCYRAQPPGPA